MTDASSTQKGTKRHDTLLDMIKRGDAMLFNDANLILTTKKNGRLAFYVPKDDKPQAEAFTRKALDGTGKGLVVVFLKLDVTHFRDAYVDYIGDLITGPVGK